MRKKYTMYNVPVPDMVDAATAAADSQDGLDKPWGASERERHQRYRLVMTVVVNVVLACS